jgi:CDP-diacylglycerol--glycerol-3-phosphate 3-phosphatidyltransferase
LLQMAVTKPYGALSFLVQEAPGFALRGSQVKVITDPSAFYGELLKRASSAKERIAMSALYLGTGKLEKRLVEAISENVASRKTDLRVSVLLDFCRGTRVVGKESSCTVLQKLLKQVNECLDKIRSALL